MGKKLERIRRQVREDLPKRAPLLILVSKVFKRLKATVLGAGFPKVPMGLYLVYAYQYAGLATIAFTRLPVKLGRFAPVSGWS